MVPWWAWTMARQTDSPMPDDPSVERNGSNAWRRASEENPGPRSLTVIVDAARAAPGRDGDRCTAGVAGRVVDEVGDHLVQLDLVDGDIRKRRDAA